MTNHQKVAIESLYQSLINLKGLREEEMNHLTNLLNKLKDELEKSANEDLERYIEPINLIIEWIHSLESLTIQNLRPETIQNLMDSLEKTLSIEYAKVTGDSKEDIIENSWQNLRRLSDTRYFIGNHSVGLKATSDLISNLKSHVPSKLGNQFQIKRIFDALVEDCNEHIKDLDLDHRRYYEQSVAIIQRESNPVP